MQVGKFFIIFKYFQPISNVDMLKCGNLRIYRINSPLQFNDV